MNPYELHKHQMVENHVRLYLPRPLSAYRSENMARNLQLLSRPEKAVRQASAIPPHR